MFTGIVEAVGRIAARGAGRRRRAAARRVRTRSISPTSRRRQHRRQRLLPDGRRHRGRDCSTSTCRPRRCAARRASRAGGDVNLEKALRLADRLGGHLVSGHVDGVGTVTAFDAGRRRIAGGSWRARSRGARAARALHRRQGLDRGRRRQPHRQCALTGARFTVNLIPHTLAVTTLGRLAVGATVNLEVDLVARYVERLHDGATLRRKKSWISRPWNACRCGWAAARIRRRRRATAR